MDVPADRPAPPDESHAMCPRESMRVLPRWSQLPLTMLTGKPLARQRAVHLSRTFHLAGAVASLCCGVAVSTVALLLGGGWLAALVVGWAMTLHGMRNLRMMIYHQCSHRNMYGRPRLDQAIGRAIAGVLVVQNFRRYTSEHVSEHHSVHHMTLRDPTVQAFLVGLRLRPGMTRRQMWARLLRCLTSPRFHARFAVARVQSLLHGASRAERWVAAGCYGTLVLAAVATGTWPYVLVAWFVPLVPLFQVSNTLRLCVKHTFPAPGIGERRGRAYFASLTNAIFVGEPVPTPSARRWRRTVSWVRWGARMAFVHLPSRYLVLTGDTVCHDYHHRYPTSQQWQDYVFARAADDESGRGGWPPYTEVWGLVPAIDHVLSSLSVADPEEYDVERLPAVTRREVFATFDD